MIMKTPAAKQFTAVSKAFQIIAVLLLVSHCGIGGVLAASSAPTEQITKAAQQFLRTLNDSQRAEVQFEFDDAEQRVRWSNLPINMVERAGLRMGDLTEPQRSAAMNILKAALSQVGYEKIVGIVQSDEVLKQQGGGRLSFGEDEFFLSFMGQPSATSPWMIQFGGHHLGLNVTLAGEHGVVTPSLIAVQPAKFEWNGKTVRPMGRETDQAFELVKSLNESQREKAILGYEMRDLALGPGKDGETIQPEGLKVSALNQDQKKRLLELISEWAGIIHETSAKEKMKEIESHLADTWFAWAGPVELGKGYFRIQGPTVIIEYAPQRLGGDVTMHIHSMFRDPTNDYGKKFISK